MTPDPEFKDTDFSLQWANPQPEPDGRADGFDPQGDNVAAEFMENFRRRNEPLDVEYDDEPTD